MDITPRVINVLGHDFVIVALPIVPESPTVPELPITLESHDHIASNGTEKCLWCDREYHVNEMSKLRMDNVMCGYLCNACHGKVTLKDIESVIGWDSKE